jgi:hypothetical protein
MLEYLTSRCHGTDHDRGENNNAVGVTLCANYTRVNFRAPPTTEFEHLEEGVLRLNAAWHRRLSGGALNPPSQVGLALVTTFLCSHNTS